MRIRAATLVKIAVALVVVAVIAAVVVLKSIDLNQYKGLIAEKVEEATGRKLVIAGPIYLSLFTLQPAIAVDDVSFSNAAWGTRPEMVRLKRLDAQVALLPLLSKRVVVKRLVLVAPDILLETNAKGEANWAFGKPAAKAEPQAPPAAGPGVLPVVNEVGITDGSLTYLDGVTGKKTTLKLDNLSARAASAASPLAISIAGEYNDNAFKVDGTLGPLAELTAPKAPFPLDLAAEAGGASVKLKGTIAKPMEAKGINIDLSVEGKSLADAGALAGASLPKVGPYALAAHVADADGGIKVEHLKGTLGKSDLSGDLVLIQGKKPTVRATFASKLLDLSELAPPSGEGAKAPSGTGEAKGGAAKDGRLFSDAPLPLDGLKAANADVKLAADQLVLPNGLALGNVAVTLTLVDGLLTVKPVSADVVNGKVAANVSLDARQPQAGLALDAKANDLDLAEMVKEMKINQKVDGKATFEGSAKGQGASVRAIMAGLNGQTSLSIGEMRVDNTLMKIVMADLAKAVVGQGDASKINCVISRFDIAKGLATSKTLVVDTESVTIRGSGTVNLATEQLDLYLDPSPKAAAVADLAIPVKITGTLASPSVAPDPAALAKKLGSAVTGVAGAATGAGLAGGMLGKIVGEQATGEDKGAAAAGGDPCAEALGMAPAKAPAQSAKPGQPAAQPAAKQPAPKPSSPIEDVGKKLKGLFD
ncbi:MAG: AsmA family protein [Alphaproteobacteria bacterium]